MSGPVGVWVFGARGAVATTTIAGAAAIGRGAADQTGLVTALPAFAALDLAGPGELIFGGHEVRNGTLREEAEQLVTGGVLPPAVAAVARDALDAAEARIRPGTTLGAGAAVRGMGAGAARPECRSAPEVLDALRADLAAFRAAIPGGRVVAVNLCSTEARGEPLDALRDAGALDAAESGGRVPAAVLYTHAALAEGFPFVNFTPLPGTEVPALAALAAAAGVPHAGKDGKTGETLLKSVLAPLFRDRHLEVLSWSGVNLLGNRDGEALRDPGANAAKVADKDRVLPAILGDAGRRALTRIDFVPSLGDWKTAWDLVHFAGFLGVRMQMQVTWQGCDSALAAPLVLDLVRLADLAARRGEVGPMAHTAVFFKSPIAGGPAAFAEQMQRLENYAASASQPASAPADEGLCKKGDGEMHEIRG